MERNGKHERHEGEINVEETIQSKWKCHTERGSEKRERERYRDRQRRLNTPIAEQRGSRYRFPRKKELKVTYGRPIYSFACLRIIPAVGGVAAAAASGRCAATERRSHFRVDERSSAALAHQCRVADETYDRDNSMAQIMR
jgi:hypothetical protein